MHRSWLIVLAYNFVSSVTRADFNVTGPNNSTITDAFPQLVDFSTDPPSYLALTLGGQDFDHCCSVAVRDSLVVQDGQLGFNNDTNGSVQFDSDLDAFRKRQYPCGANYIGDREGAPVVKISHRWCKTNCRGWQISKNSKISQWVSPFVGFLVPAIVFCLAIPRRRKINIPAILFAVPLNAITSYPRTPFIAVAAAILASLDTIQWLMTIFALAGPILLSGMYEATLDSSILAYVQNNLKRKDFSTAQRAHLLYIVLVGNLDMLAGAAYDEAHAACNDIDAPRGLLGEVFSVAKDATDRKYVVDCMKTKLRDMLAAQYSFGVTVGAPVVFFCGSFLYTLIDNYSNLGDNNVSHALAFGMWWMTIPHVSIAAGLLLAGNNPNTLEGVVGRPWDPDESLKFGFLELVYESHYKPAWIWNRGRSKKLWAQRVTQDPTTVKVPPDFEEVLEMKAGDWFTVALLAYSLILIPSVLAFLTSYYTPYIGLSCRSMTFLVYMLCQLWLIALWVWDIESTSLKNGIPHSPCTRRPPTSNLTCWINWQPWVWYFLTIVAGSIATFVAIGGTMMQIIGVYRNCLCQIPISTWHAPDDVLFNISTNTKEDIDYANRLWQNTGATAVTFLGFVTFFGWWYQKRLRYQFKLITKNIGQKVEIPDGIQQNGVPQSGVLPNSAPSNDAPPNGASPNGTPPNSVRLDDFHV